MARFLFRLLAVLFLTVGSQRMLGSASDDTDAIDDKPKTKQISTGPLLFGNVAAPQAFYIPYYQSIYNWDPRPAATSRRSYFRRIMFLIWAARRSSSTATQPETEAPSGSCVWSPWSSCSELCGGKRTRTRMCAGNTRAEEESCNTETGFQEGGLWYRAKNCYEYFWSTEYVDTHAIATTKCSGLGARLASTGMRDDDVRKDVVTKIAIQKGVSTMKPTLLGVTNQYNPNVYVWSDGYEGDPTFWSDGEPSVTTVTPTTCLNLLPGNPSGLRQLNCFDASFSYLCERPAE